MNEYTFNEIDLSKEYNARFTVTITEAMVDTFRELTGDHNPLHKQKDYAKAKGYNDTVVFGMLVASFYSTLAGMYLPGKNCLLQRVDTHFHLPVYIGDILTVTGYIKKKVDLGNTLIISAEIINQKGETVNSAKIEAGCSE